ncbi:MAG: DNA repair protein RadA [Firmicutes bacterium]|nr:DNA repair protein RadA [Bacillota bacterium]
MAKVKTKYVCGECGYETGRWMGKCPSCGNFGTLNEEIEESVSSSARRNVSGEKAKIYSLKNIENDTEERTATKIEELDRVLSGGIVKGSLTLVGGDPGIGKSTLLLQICQSIGQQNKKILYVSGEESVNQIKLRAVRLGITTENLMLLSETSFNIAEAAINKVLPNMVIIDSIQTMYMEELTSAPGSVTQVRECTARMMRIAKGKGISIMIVGHVTKDGSIAGPRILEHMVDTVLYFEGERQASYRVLRAVKNRFGSTNEIGVFEMRDNGLVQIDNPSEYMLSGRPVGASGSVITCSVEGTRPILTEVQALISYTTFNMPRRMATGMDFNRAILLTAVLEKRAGYQFGSYDSYVNLAGGIRINEPSLDCAVVAAMASSYKNIAVDAKTVIFGEVGLTGEIRAVSHTQKRVLECAKLGFERCVMPRANVKEIKKNTGINVVGVANISELLDAVL